MGKLTFDRYQNVKEKIRYERISQYLTELYNHHFSYGTVVQLCGRETRNFINEMIRPRLTDDERTIIDCCTKYSGITRVELDNGILYADVIGRVKALLRGAIVIGYNVQSDLDAPELIDPVLIIGEVQLTIVA